MSKLYNELTLEEQKKVYENYKAWFDTLTKKEAESIDDGGFSTFEDFHLQASWINLLYDAKTLEAIG